MLSAFRVVPHKPQFHYAILSDSKHKVWQENEVPFLSAYFISPLFIIIIYLITKKNKILARFRPVADFTSYLFTVFDELN